MTMKKIARAEKAMSAPSRPSIAGISPMQKIMYGQNGSSIEMLISGVWYGTPARPSVSPGQRKKNWNGTSTRLASVVRSPSEMLHGVPMNEKGTTCVSRMVHVIKAGISVGATIAVPLANVLNGMKKMNQTAARSVSGASASGEKPTSGVAGHAREPSRHARERSPSTMVYVPRRRGGIKRLHSHGAQEIGRA